MTNKERPVIVYFTGTNQTRRLIEKINPNGSFDTLRVRTGNESINYNTEYILITPTYKKGSVPKQVRKFLDNNHTPNEVIGTGNRQWGEHFCGAGKKISEEFNIPLIQKVEQSGHFNEVENIKSYFGKQYKVVYN